jgi:propanediol utilization protein
MNNADFEALARVIMGRIFIPLEASGRHVHVTAEQAHVLFGHPLTPKRPLSQPGQFLANERITVIGPKGKLDNVAVLGPERKEAQVEISLTDSRALGVTPPVRPSGDVSDSPGCILSSPRGQVALHQGIIAAQRHIHMTPEDAARMQVTDKQTVRLRTYTARPLVLEDVLVRVSPDYATYAHLDYDEANACGFVQGDLARLVT